MATPDPISLAVSTLSNIATPQETGGSYAGGTATGTTIALPLGTLISTVFPSGTDAGTVIGEIGTALNDVSTVVNTLASQLNSLTSFGSDVAVLTGLQNGLAAAQALSPSSANTVLTSGSQLFAQLQQLLTYQTTVANAVSQLYQLNQQLQYITQNILKPQ